MPDVQVPEVPKKTDKEDGGSSGGGSGAGRRRREWRWQRLELRRREPGQPRDGQPAQRRRPRARRGAREGATRSSGRSSADGTPDPANPTFSLSTPGPARIGVPNFFIDKFRVPPFLLPIYQAAGIQYGVRWEILAAINEIETDYGRNLNVSSAGALGWMQFMPATWRAYGVDANGDGKSDPYNPVDAIFAAARYLRAAGADTDIRQAVFAYNHANWYVDSVLLRAQVIGGMPANLVGSLTGLTQGRFPVLAKATYADQLKRRGKRVRQGNAAMVVEPTDRDDIKVFTRARSRVVAVNDGKVLRVGVEPPARQLRRAAGRLRQHVHLRAPRQRRQALPVAQAAHGDRGRGQEGAGAPEARRRARPGRLLDRPPGAQARRSARWRARAAPKGREKAPEAAKQRLFANPARPNSAEAGGAQQEFERTGVIDGWQTFEGYFSRIFGLDRKDVKLKRLRRGSRVVAGTVLGRVAGATTRAPRTCCSRSVRRAAAPRRSTRSRSSTAGSCSSRPPSTARPARTRSSGATPPTRRSARSC